MVMDRPGSAASVEAFEAVRGRLFGLAYRMLASHAEAEDVVQDAYVRWHGADHARIESSEAWLVRVTTRLAIDRLRALRVEREAYRGLWLPEPRLEESAPPPDQQVELASDLTIAFLVLLERLAPEERAAFLLREVFGCGYGDVATVLDKKEATCRQIVRRARERVRTARRRFPVTEAAKADLLRRFVAAVEAKDAESLLALCTPDATWSADGGGKIPAAPYPIVGANRIAKLVVGLTKTLLHPQQTALRLASVNGETGLCLRSEGRIRGVLAFDCEGAHIRAVYTIVNPEKLDGVLPPCV
jgi:RNA polymerase sigma-70 factor, ECF subfamily